METNTFPFLSPSGEWIGFDIGIPWRSVAVLLYFLLLADAKERELIMLRKLTSPTWIRFPFYWIWLGSALFVSESIGSITPLYSSSLALLALSWLFVWCWHMTKTAVLFASLATSLAVVQAVSLPHPELILWSLFQLFHLCATARFNYLRQQVPMAERPISRFNVATADLPASGYIALHDPLPILVSQKTDVLPIHSSQLLERECIMKRANSTLGDAETKRTKVDESAELLRSQGEVSDSEDFSAREEKFEDEQGDIDSEPVDLQLIFPPDKEELKRVDREGINWKTHISPSMGPWGLYTDGDLQLTPDMSEVFGMPNIRDLLLTRIYRVVQTPERYAINIPLLDTISMVQRLFYFYGRHGTGVNLLLRAFCKRTGISLIEAFGANFNPKTQLDELYATAMRHTPSIVLFTDCEQHFCRDSAHAVVLVQLLKRLVQNGAPIWTIFRSEVQVSALDGRLASIMDYVLWTQTPDPLARGQLFLKALIPYMQPREDGKAPINKRELRQLVDKSHDCIPRNIFGFVRHCCNHKIALLGAEAALCEDNHLRLRVIDLTFSTLPHLKRRITDIDPTQDNVRAFGQHH